MVQGQARAKIEASLKSKTKQNKIQKDLFRAEIGSVLKVLYLGFST
jgi:hypothetical protein